MFQTYLTKNLQEGEELLRVVRRSAGSFLPDAIVGVVFVFAPFFFLFPLFRLGGAGVGLFFLAFALGLFVIFRAVMRYVFTVLCITDRRMIDIDQRGLFDRLVSDIAYSAIREVRVSVKGVRQTVLGLGTLHIVTAGEAADYEFRDIRDAEQLRELITSRIGNLETSSVS